MLKRHKYNKVLELLDSFPAVALTGPRQVGKTTLALQIARERPAVYLDLENPRDLAKIRHFEPFYRENSDNLVILDEVQRMPELFAELRGIIDAERRKGRRTGRFLFLGSASIDLLKQSSETLAGRIAFVELFPLNGLEVAGGGDETLQHMDRLWARGGFPESYLADSDPISFEWRLNFIRTYLERDIPQLGPRIPAETLRRFWTMLAHQQGAILNAANIARGLGVSGQTVARYLDLLVDLLLVRRLQPWAGNVGKRLIRSPKIYIRDSGIANTLLDITYYNQLLGHPSVGGIWEGFVIENLFSAVHREFQAFFYRSSTGEELDLVLQFGMEDIWAIEIKRSSAPKPSKGYWTACATLNATRKIIVYPGYERFPLSNGAEAMGVIPLMEDLKSRSRL